VREAELRLATEEVGWLTTVTPAGVPQSSPVWFLWHDGAVWIASEPSAAKLVNLAGNPAASFHLEGAGPGDLVVTIEGEATVGGTVPAPYAEKYAAALVRLATTSATYLGDFSATVRLVPSRVRMFRAV